MVIIIGTNADISAKAQCTTYLIPISLFCCLRLYEYTKRASYHCTTYICFQDVHFHKAEGIIPGDAPDQTFLDTWSTTLFLDTQKIIVQEELTSMEASGIPHRYAVPAAAYCFIYLHNNGLDPQASPPHHMYVLVCSRHHPFFHYKSSCDRHTSCGEL